jgi:aldehyde:ferredoxin oxidoreductase
MATATYGGWTGKTLRVNLSTKKITTEDTIKKYKDYLGGTGLGYKVLWDEVPAKTKAFDDANKIILAVGPLTGTSAPTSGRTSITTIFPPSYPDEVVATGHMGGHWGAELKYAGWDAVIVEGKSETPVYISIQDAKVEIKDAKHLWGSGTYHTTLSLCQEMGPETQVASIGQAGENLVRMASIQNAFEHSAGGVGGVFGAKKLKAIAVKGTGGVRIAGDRAAWKKLHLYVMSLLGGNNQCVVPSSPQPWAEFTGNTRWNARKGYFWGAADPPVETGECPPEDLTSIGLRTNQAVSRLGALVEKYHVRNGGCSSCPIRCHWHVAIPSLEQYGVSRFTATACERGRSNDMFPRAGGGFGPPGAPPAAAPGGGAAPGGAPGGGRGAGAGAAAGAAAAGGAPPAGPGGGAGRGAAPGGGAAPAGAAARGAAPGGGAPPAGPGGGPGRGAGAAAGAAGGAAAGGPPPAGAPAPAAAAPARAGGPGGAAAAGPSTVTSTMEGNCVGAHMIDDYGIWTHYSQMLRDISYAWRSGALKASLPAEEYNAIPWDQFQRGDPMFIKEMYRRIAYQEGLMGKAFAAGPGRTADMLKFGPDYYTDSSTMYWGKGLPQHHANGDNGQVGVLVNMIYNRDAANHSTSNFTTAGLPTKVMLAVAEKNWGPGAVDPRGNYTPMTEAKAKWAKWGLLRKEMHDSLTLCNYNWPMSCSPLRSRNYEGDLTCEAQLYSLATGDKKTQEELDLVCERIFNLHRALTMRDKGTMEMREKQDVLPSWLFDSPTGQKPFTPGSNMMDRADMELAKDLLYDQLGWDRKTGAPTRATLERLGLKDVADSLAKMNLLPA